MKIMKQLTDNTTKSAIESNGAFPYKLSPGSRGGEEMSAIGVQL
jgi:hypothetical protein